MTDPQRAELATVAVDAHALVGLWACHLDRPAVAYRHLAVACEIAMATAEKGLRACALGALSYLYSSAPRGGCGGRPRRALALLNEALGLAEHADGFTRGWLTVWRADQLAALGDLPAARHDVQAADRWLDDPTEHTAGFFARGSYGYGMRSHLASVAATVEGLAGDIGQAQAQFADVQRMASNARRRVASHAHLAFVHTHTRTRHRDPEAACATLARAVDLAAANGYAMGLTPAAGVRAGFEHVWDTLPCVRDLDERLSHHALAS